MRGIRNVMVPVTVKRIFHHLTGVCSWPFLSRVPLCVPQIPLLGLANCYSHPNGHCLFFYGFPFSPLSSHPLSLTLLLGTHWPKDFFSKTPKAIICSRDSMCHGPWNVMVPGIPLTLSQRGMQLPRCSCELLQLSQVHASHQVPTSPSFRACIDAPHGIQ